MVPLYRIVLLHAKVNRIIKRRSSIYLSAYNLSSVEWVLLGYLADNLEGKRIREIARQISVEPPFITSLLDKLEKIKFVKCRSDKNDKRAKTITISKSGLNALAMISKQFNEKDANIFSAIHTSELSTYLHVLEELSMSYA